MVILECLTAGVLELAGLSHTALLSLLHTLMHLMIKGNALKDLHVKHIMPQHLQLAIQGDEELDMFMHAMIAGGGIMPFIHKTLTAGKAKKVEGLAAKCLHW